AANSSGGASSAGGAGKGGSATSSGGAASGAGGTTSGGASSAGTSAGGAGNAGAANAGTGNGGSVSNGVQQACTTTVNTTLPGDAPDLIAGTWVDLTPPSIPKGNAENLIGQGLVLDPCDMKTLYWGNTPFTEADGALYKTTNAGADWSKIGQLDMPLHTRVDPRDSQHLYAGDGVRGGTLGFWISTDGGGSWTKPQGYTDTGTTGAAFIEDVYDVAIDPSDFDHVLVSSHSAWGWTDSKWNTDAGVLESKDGGKSWTMHDPEPGWGAGHSIDFLYNPAQGIGNADTWILGTQGDGQWRTTDAGATWTKVTDHNIFHGGGETYYSKTGVLYATSGDGLLRSENNGESFDLISNAGNGNTGVWGDGNLLYTAPAYGFGAQAFRTSPEDDGLTWTTGTQTFDGSGPFEMAFDAANGILYASMWFQGVWALKVE
ncbi:MAG TPA: hypothetical protein VGP93_02505, partial [Polyangiaceae bacterium]|nr:hypothetical protein [Polyangiaceae bacterium]